jgi:hypothetical protein
MGGMDGMGDFFPSACAHTISWNPKNKGKLGPDSISMDASAIPVCKPQANAGIRLEWWDVVGQPVEMIAGVRFGEMIERNRAHDRKVLQVVTMEEH